jgi:hypothetical protein
MIRLVYIQTEGRRRKTNSTYAKNATVSSSVNLIIEKLLTKLLSSPLQTYPVHICSVWVMLLSCHVIAQSTILSGHHRFECIGFNKKITLGLKDNDNYNGDEREEN